MALGDRLVADVQGFEEGLVEQAPYLVVGSQVEVVEAIAEDLQSEIERVGRILVAEVQASNQGLGVFSTVP